MRYRGRNNILYHTKNLVLNGQIITREVKKFVLNGLFQGIVQIQLERFIVAADHFRHCMFLVVCLQNTAKYQNIEEQTNNKKKRNTKQKFCEF